MADFIFKISPNIILGAYSTSRLGQFVKEWGSRFMLIIDPVLNDYGISEKIKSSLNDRKIDYFVFDEIPMSPDSSVLQQALDLAREAHIHGIICAGGMKAENLGRATAALYNEAHDIYTYIDGAVPTSGALPLICIPTSMKDMFLFSDQTPVTDGRNRQLKMLKTQSGLCKLALFDPNLSVSLTENQSASISLQILCLAIECYISQKANFFSDTIAEKAIELLAGGMGNSTSLNSATPAEHMLIQGGCMASLAAGASSIGTASILSMAISARYSLPQSVVTSILLPHIIEEAAKFKSDRIAKVARILHVASDTASDDVAANALAENIRSRLAMANLPARLKDMSVTIEQLSLAAEDAGQLELINYLPRSTNADDLFDLIKQAF